MATKAATPRVPPRPSSITSVGVRSRPGSGPATMRNTMRALTSTTVLPIGASAGMTNSRLAFSRAMAQNPTG